jgi:hypothetical protein
MEGLNSATWRKSSYSGGNGGGCVEAANADAAGRVVLVRDTTNREGAMLSIAADAWEEFLGTLR